MKQRNEQAKVSEKNRMRDEIDAQIRYYLQRGGKIDVVTPKQPQQRTAIGQVWHSAEEMIASGH